MPACNSTINPANNSNKSNCKRSDAVFSILGLTIWEMLWGEWGWQRRGRSPWHRIRVQWWTWCCSLLDLFCIVEIPAYTSSWWIVVKWMKMKQLVSSSTEACQRTNWDGVEQVFSGTRHRRNEVSKAGLGLHWYFELGCQFQARGWSINTR